MKSCRSQWWATSACLLWLVQHVAILRVVRKSLWTTLDAFHDFVKIMFDNFDNATKNSCLLHVVKLLHFYLDPFHTRSMHGHPASLHAPSHLGQKDCSISMHIILLNIIKSHIVTWKLESNWHRKMMTGRERFGATRLSISCDCQMYQSQDDEGENDGQAA